MQKQHTGPHTLGYPVPDDEAVDTARRISSDDPDADPIDAARATCLLLAAAVRDLLVDDIYDPTAPFDAVELEMAHAHATGLVEPTGHYWTADGTRLPLPGEHDRNRLTNLAQWDLGNHSRAAWSPLCTLQGTTIDAAIYRLDLTQAATIRITDPQHDPAAASATSGLNIVTRYLQGHSAASSEEAAPAPAQDAFINAVISVLHAADGWHHAPRVLERALTLLVTSTPPRPAPDTHPRDLEALAGAIADILRTGENTTGTTAYSLADAAEATFQDEVDAARFAHIRHIRQD
ncbi:hypothetical protein [Streptomyces erythrochromogenes]|uniref:hypothetical protein n=1 Tax=Streptomyces erythrochromogenes TaxID=285574 RepID=UPI00386455F9|nr:hypothetical protein OG489_00110 [Streptomyces erythrochromogenes]WSR88344.1 hypothetical protein OG489_39850 [Streptomyces erythrochromogenes]